MWYILSFIAGIIFCFIFIVQCGERIADYLDRLVEKRKNGK